MGDKNKDEVMVTMAESTSEEIGKVVDKEQAIKDGTSPEEIAMLEKHGMVGKEETPEEKTEREKKEQENVAEKKHLEEEKVINAGKTPEEIEAAATEAKKKIEDEAKEVEAIRKKGLDNISDDESRKLSKNEQGFYWANKKERSKRQAAETERDYFNTKLRGIEGDVGKLTGVINVFIEKIKAQGDLSDVDVLGIINEEIQKAGLKIEGTNVTEEDWKKKQDDENAVLQMQNQRINARLLEFETDAKASYDDLDEGINLADDIFKNYKTLFPEPTRQREIEGKIKSWTIGMANMFDVNSPNMSVVAYEIGKLHPNYKKKTTDKVEDQNKKKLSDEEMKKVLEAQKKTSANLGSAGSGKMPASELTLETLRNLPLSEYRKVPKEVRDRILREG